MKLLKLAPIMLTACLDQKSYPVNKVAWERCVLSCVNYHIAPLYSVTDSVIKEFATLCEAALKERECCTSKYFSHYATPCDEQ